jgi:hypothetical protein
MPMHLVRDAMRGVLPDAACEPLAAWRVEWRHAPVREAWSHAHGPERARRSLDAWVPRPGSGEALRIAATTTGERWVGCDAPATCAWSVEGSWGVEGPVVHGAEDGSGGSVREGGRGEGAAPPSAAGAAGSAGAAGVAAGALSICSCTRLIASTLRVAIS